MSARPDYPFVRRVVTGHGAGDVAKVLVDANASNEKYPDPGVISTLIWSTDTMPAAIPVGEDAEDMGNRKLGSAPPPHGSRFAIIDFPPGNPVAFHRTDTLDYVIVMEGEIDNDLDDSSVHLRAGDVLIQRGTNHAWVNRGDKRARIAVVLLDAVPLGIGHAVAGAETASATPEPVHIDVIVSQTGTAAFLGQGETQALKILQGVVNAQGGIKGRPVQFDVGDDQSNPAMAVQLMQGVVAHKAPAMIGTGFTATCLAIMPLSKASGPVTYCITPGVHPPPNSFAFSANIGTEGMAPVMLRYFRERGWTRFAFISSTDASGQDLENAVNVAMQRPEFKSLTMVAREHFNTADLSVAAQIERIKAAQPQAAIFWTAGTGFGTLLRNAHDAGLDIPIMGGNANENYAQLRQYKDFLPSQLYFPSPRAIAEGGALPGPIHDAQTVYFKAYHAAGARPDLPATMAWDPAMIIIDAYRHLGPDTTADKVRDYIEGLHDWVGVNGVYDFADGSQRGLGENACVVLRYDGPTDTFLNASRPGGKLK